MKIKTSIPRKTFIAGNYIFLVLTGVICLLPFINLFAISFSSQAEVSLGNVSFIPRDFTLSSYNFIIENTDFIRAFFVSILRVLLGLIVNLSLIVLVAYPLSKNNKQLPFRNVYAWFFVITILFNGGLIPTFMIVRYTGLLDSIWALVLPGALPVFSMLVVMNFLRSLPAELEEAALIDGANYLQILIYIILPVVKPALATVALFSIVFHWNSWFDGMIYIQRPENLPLQSYLQTIIINPGVLFSTNINISADLAETLRQISPRTIRAAQLLIAAIPVLIVYPFLQKYFSTGLVLGSVKG